MPRIHIINVTNEGNDNVFYIQYKVNGIYTEHRATKKYIAEYLAMNNEITSQDALESFSQMIEKPSTKATLFDSYLKYYVKLHSS